MNRPNPDALLKRVQAEESPSRTARLKVFFGMAPGVGKTYAMLSQACERLAAGVARWAFEHTQTAGAGTNTLPAARAIYLPLKGAHETEGALSVSLRSESDASTRLSLLAPSSLHDLETLASQVALALECPRLADAAHSTQVQIETEQLPNSLLSAVSHDLRTPLASIVGASSSLMQEGTALSQGVRDDLLRSISHEADRLHRLVSNLWK